MKKLTPPMTKSPRRVARAALEIGREALPAYSCRTSRQDFTQAQLFAVLALKTDYRGVVALLEDFAELRADLNLAKVPHYSTLGKAAKRLLKKRGLRCCSGGPSAAPACAA